MNTEGKVISNKLQADVVVVGGGGSGLAAAASAAEAGVKNVILLEKSLKLGGNAKQSGGFFAVESPAQKRLGINITTDEVFKKHMAQTRWRDNPKLVRAWMNRSGDLVGWLEGKGVEFTVNNFMAGGLRLYHVAGEFFDGEFPGAVKQKGQQVVGLTGPILEALTRSCEEQGVSILRGTQAIKLMTGKKGEITGVLARDKKQGKEVLISTQCVIIGTGGFARNKELLKKYFPGYGDGSNIYTHSFSQMTGDGYMMAAAAGAATDELVTFIIFSPHHYPWNPHITWLVRRPFTLWVNKNGERYIDESVWVVEGGVGWAVSKQPDNLSYTLLDSQIIQDIKQRKETLTGGLPDWLDELDNDIESEAAKGRIKIANTWDEIAEYIGADPSVLKTEVEHYNSLCDNGHDNEFSKDKTNLLPLRIPPYYALLARQGFDSAIGGIKINHRLEALDKHGKPIKGLYIVGNDAGGTQGDTYNFDLPGSSLGFALTSGYMAGEYAARYLLTL